jgi:hypothetical protein
VRASGDEFFDGLRVGGLNFRCNFHNAFWLMGHDVKDDVDA